MSLIAKVREAYQRYRTRKALLATPGVDLLVRRVMDARYGKHNWRVRDDQLEALVVYPGDRELRWGLIGPLHAHRTRVWLRNGGTHLSHAKVRTIPQFVDTYPVEDSK